MTNSCFAWTPEGQWEQYFSDLNVPHWAHIMVLSRNIETTSDERVPLVLGQDPNTEILSPSSETWENYRPLLVNDWNSIGCLVQYGDKVYHISDKVYELDLNTWNIYDLAAVPNELTNPGKCAIATIEGVPGKYIYLSRHGKRSRRMLYTGIMTRNGYWFSLLYYTWESKKFPPYYNGALLPNALHNFRGKATVFGGNQCDDEGTCTFTDVLQYDSDKDLWISMGRMVKSRTMHEVIEVPKEFCDVVVHPPPSQDSAALIIGGVGGFEDNGRREIHNSVEIFGCPNSLGQSAFLDDFPVSVYMTGGNYFEQIDQDEDAPEGGVILVCGGYTCEGENNINCGIRSDCYQWTKAGGWVLRDEELDRNRWAHIMASAPNVRSGSNAPHPIVMGLTDVTAIYSYEEEDWEEYELLPERNWVSPGCLVQYQDTIYHIRENIYALNTLTWEVRTIAAVPENLSNSPGRCSVNEINGQEGIFSLMNYQYFFIDNF